MDFLILLCLFLMPGVMAVSIHNKKLIHITRENRKKLLLEFFLYSFAIVFSVNFVMFITCAERTAWFLPWTILTPSARQSNLIFKCMFLAVLVALAFPILWRNRHNIREWLNNRKDFKLNDDE